MNLGKDGYYRSTFRHDGKVYTVAGKTEAEVYRKIGRRKAELEAGKRPAKNITVAQYARQWIEVYRGSDSNPDKRSRWTVRKYIVPKIGDYKMAAVTESTLQKFVNEIPAELAKGTAGYIVVTLKQIFQKAQKNGVIQTNPAAGIKDMAKREARKRRSITDDERSRLLAALPGTRVNLLCKIMLYCGLRPGEVRALTWSDIDLAHGLIHVTKAVKSGSSVIGPPKSAAGVRDVPIPGILLRELPGGPPDEFVVQFRRNGKPASSCHAGKLARAVFRAAGLPEDVDVYCLRHTYCTDLQRAGVPINVARELMGHSSVEMTARIYTHTDLDTKEAAVAALDRLVGALPRNTELNTNRCK